MVRMPSFPFCIDFLPDERLLIVSARDRLLLRREPDGSLVTHTDLSSLPEHPWNDIVVDGRGNAYVGNLGFEFQEDEFAPESSRWSPLMAWLGRQRMDSLSPMASS
jgi:sugar lactone lactonase YvrE